MLGGDQLSDGVTFRISLDSKIEGMSETMKREMNDLVHLTGHDVERTWKQGIRLPPKTGRVYIIRGKAHQASAPGEFPANLTGTLMNSIQVDNSQRMRSVVWQDDSAAPWGFWLELGTVSIDPRPHAAPAGEAHRERFIDKATEVLASLGRNV